MNLCQIGAALKGMFRLTPSSPAHKAMLEELDELRAVTNEICGEQPCEFDSTMDRITEAMR
jgi:hypothetical protein